MLYAAYGSNLHPSRLRARVASARLIDVTRLPGYRLCFHKRSHADGSGKCMLLPSEQFVYVAIYEMAPAELSILDSIEGEGNGYQRITIAIPGAGDCEMYLACDSHIDESLKPFSWYQDLVVLGCKALALPDHYICSIRTTPVTSDPHLARQTRHQLLLRQLKNVAIQVSQAGV